MKFMDRAQVPDCFWNNLSFSSTSHFHDWSQKYLREKSIGPFIYFPVVVGEEIKKQICPNVQPRLILHVRCSFAR